jgi:hypothetical protein
LDERRELITLLSSCDPRDFSALCSKTSNSRLRAVLPFYIPKQKSELFEIWARQKAITQDAMSRQAMVAEDERVEDAGLEQDLENISPPANSKDSTRGSRAVA